MTHQLVNTVHARTRARFADSETTYFTYRGYVMEIADRVLHVLRGPGQRAVHRALDNMEDAGLVSVSRRRGQAASRLTVTDRVTAGRFEVWFGWPDHHVEVRAGG